jgi:phosphatidyl-myo-inositol alpha-mannosyltransferase
MKVGIVVPFSWSYWGGVVEHAEQQARSLMALGHDARIIIGNDPPGLLTTLLHPRSGRHTEPPEFVIPVGRTVIVPANSSLSNVCLTAQTIRRIKLIMARERFDVVHVHEPYAPVISLAGVYYADCPVVVTSHASGGRWWPWGKRFWGVIMERIDYLISVSEHAREAAQPWLDKPIEVLPNGVSIPEKFETDGREHRVVFVGRHEARKGLPVLLRAWPSVAERTGARLRVIGADPLAVRFLLRRVGVGEDSIDILGVLSAEGRDAEIAAAKVLAAPSVGGESFGMVLTEAFACGTPVVASSIQGYVEVAGPDTGVLVPPGDEQALADALVGLLSDEPRRRALGVRARAVAEERYSWLRIAERLVQIYESLLELERGEAEAA